MKTQPKPKRPARAKAKLKQEAVPYAYEMTPSRLKAMKKYVYGRLEKEFGIKCRKDD